VREGDMEKKKGSNFVLLKHLRSGNKKKKADNENQSKAL
jgi:hypothetical protein